MNPSSDPVEANSSDKTWALWAYMFTPFLPAVMLLVEDIKKRPYIRAHLAQSLVLGITGFVVNSLLSAVLIGCITWPL
jgi:hypothetical protein